MNAQDRELVELTAREAAREALDQFHERHKDDCRNVCGTDRMWAGLARQGRRLRRIEFFLVGGGSLGVIAATAWKLVARFGG